MATNFRVKSAKLPNHLHSSRRGILKRIGISQCGWAR